MHKTARSIIAYFLSICFICYSLALLDSTVQAEGLRLIQAVKVQIAEIGQWELNKGDWVYVNVENNTLRFVNAENDQFSYEYVVGSGEKLKNGRKKCYLDSCYDPLTPESTWEIRSKTQQNWYNVFGSKEADEQLFLRLYELNGQSTYYGIHTTPDVETIFSDLDGFGSWGCVLTRYDLLKKIEELYHLNDKVVRVITSKKDIEDVLEEV